jgi:hypothetical protein
MLNVIFEASKNLKKMCLQDDISFRAAIKNTLVLLPNIYINKQCTCVKICLHINIRYKDNFETCSTQVWSKCSED